MWGVLRTRDTFGFNYDGSWGSSGLDLWEHHDPGEWRPKSDAGSASDGMITEVEEMLHTAAAPDSAH
jgi:hypothetical protein